MRFLREMSVYQSLFLLVTATCESYQPSTFARFVTTVFDVSRCIYSSLPTTE